MTTGFDSPKMLISHLVSLVAVPVNASTGIEGDELLVRTPVFANAGCPAPCLFKKLGTKSENHYYFNGQR